MSTDIRLWVRIHRLSNYRDHQLPILFQPQEDEHINLKSNRQRLAVEFPEAVDCELRLRIPAMKAGLTGCTVYKHWSSILPPFLLCHQFFFSFVCLVSKSLFYLVLSSRVILSKPHTSEDWMEFCVQSKKASTGFKSNCAICCHSVHLIHFMNHVKAHHHFYRFTVLFYFMSPSIFECCASKLLLYLMRSSQVIPPIYFKALIFWCIARYFVKSSKDHVDCASKVATCVTEDP